MGSLYDGGSTPSEILWRSVCHDRLVVHPLIGLFRLFRLFRLVAWLVCAALLQNSCDECQACVDMSGESVTYVGALLSITVATAGYVHGSHRPNSLSCAECQTTTTDAEWHRIRNNCEHGLY